MSDQPTEGNRPLNRLFKMAVMAGVEESVRLHIRRGDDINARDDKGLTPLMIAASRNRAGTCKLLLDSGADAQLLNPAGLDALTLASLAGAHDTATVLQAALAIRPDHNGNPCERTDVVQGFASVVIGAIDDAPIPPAEVALSDGDAFDLTGWEAEDDRPAPQDDLTLAQDAAAVHDAISKHTPVDTSEEWSDFDVFLPERATPLPRSEDTEARAELRLLLLRAIREGSVPQTCVDDLCRGDDRALDEAAQALLHLVINDLGAETDERLEHTSRAESFAVYVDPDETPDEQHAVAGALAFLDDLELHRNDPMRLYMREAQRERLITAEEEVAFAKAMEDGLERALDALAEWPAGLARLLAAADLAKAGERPLEWISSGSAEEAPPEGAQLDDEALVDLSGSLTDSGAIADDDDVVGDTEEVEATDAPGSEEAGFFDKLDKLASAMSGMNPAGRQLPVMREVIASLSIRRSFLIELGDAAADDVSQPAKHFVNAIRAHRRARDRFALANLRLVLSIAKRYMGSGLLMDDLMQEGNIGLLKAVDKFDWRRGFKFSTMATWWIRQHVSRAVADTALLIRLPIHAHEAARLIHREARAFEKSAGRRPSIQELAERLSLDARKVEAFLRATAVATPLEELETEPGIDDSGLLELFEKVASDQLRRALDEVLAELGHKPEQIVRLRFGLGGADPMTLEEVGVRFEVTRERIRQIEAKALRMLKHPVRMARLRPWLYANPSDNRAAEAGNKGANEVNREESTSPTTQIGFAAKAVDAAKAIQTDGAWSKLPKLELLLAQAKHMGIPVEDDRGGAGSVWVNLTEMHDNRARALVRKMLAMGFKHWPGRGYWR